MSSQHPAMRWPLSVPVLGDGVVTLRAHTAGDIDAITEMAQDEAMVRWTNAPVPYERHHGEDFALSVIPRLWDEGASRGWAIEVDGAFAGNIDLRGRGVLDVGFALHPAARGRGVMVRAVRLVVDHAFAEGIGEVVYWRGHVGNVASLRVAHAAGFTLHGVQPGLLWERERSIDAWTASIRFGDAPLPGTRWIDDVVETESEVLRPPREQDLERWAQAESDPLTRHWSNEPKPVGVAEMRSAWHRRIWRSATGQGATWTIADPVDDRFLGQVMVTGLDHRPEIGYFLHPDARGRGIVTRALGAVVGHVLSPQGLDQRRVLLSVAAGNGASRVLAERCGFVPVGRESAAEPLVDGTHDDLIVYESLR